MRRSRSRPNWIPPVVPVLLIIAAFSTALATATDASAAPTATTSQPASAQSPSSTTVPDSSDSDAVDSSGDTYFDAMPPELLDRLQSPRETMARFLGATSRNDYAAAAECLDLSGFAEPPSTAKREDWAYKLRAIMDRLAVVQPEDISAASPGEPYVYQPDPRVPPIVIARIDNGAWLFSPATVARIDNTYQRVADWPLIRGSNWLADLFPASFLKTTFLLPNYQWVALLVVIVLGVLFDYVFRLAASRMLIAWLKFRKADVDQNAEHRVFKPMGLLVRASTWYGGLVLIQFPPSLLLILSVAVRFFAVVAGVWTCFCLIDLLTVFLTRRTQKTATKFDDLLVPLISRSLKIFVSAIGLVTFAQAFNIPIAGLLSGLGIGSLAFAFAAKDTIGNVFGSVTVLVDRPFEIGDWVKTNGVEGSVETVGMRSTRIRTFYNSLVIVPNSLLVTAVVDNMGKRSYRRLKTTIGLEYSTPPELIDAFCEGVRELIRRHPYTRKDYYHVYFNDFGASSLDVMLYCFFQCPDWSIELRERHRLLRDIVRLAADLGVGFAFPTQTVHLFQEAAKAGGDGSGDRPDAEPNDLGRRVASDIAGPLLEGGDRPGPVEF